MGLLYRQESAQPRGRVGGCGGGGGGSDNSLSPLPGVSKLGRRRGMRLRTFSSLPLRSSGVAWAGGHLKRPFLGRNSPLCAHFHASGFLETPWS